MQDLFDPPIRTTGAYGLPAEIISPIHAWLVLNDRFPRTITNTMVWRGMATSLEHFCLTGLGSIELVRDWIQEALAQDGMLVES